MEKTNMLQLTITGLAIASLVAGHSKTEYQFTYARESHHMLGGEITNITSYPYVVSLQKSNRHFCGGTILTDSIILTAARCIVGVSLSSVTIRVGSPHADTGGLTYKVDKAVIHGFFRQVSEHNFLHDLSMLRLKEPIKFFGTAHPVTLYNQNETVIGNETAKAVGWGAVYDGPSDSAIHIPDVGRIKKYKVKEVVKDSYGTVIESRLISWSVVYPQFLRNIDLLVVERDECMKIHESSELVSLEGQICASPLREKTCVDDAGGPLLIEGRQAGILSWNKGCEATEYPGVYTEIAHYRDWIEQYKKVLPTL